MITFSRRGLHGQVVDALGRRIVQGKVPPGTTLDVELLERDLAVSRTVVREAIKVLIAKGLLDARPRLGTYVRPRADWKLLDADVMEWRGQGDPDERLFRELDEVRRVVEPQGARLAAERRTPADLEALRAALDGIRATASGDREGHIAADLAFHRAVLASTGNELLERLEVVLEPALRARDTLTFGTDVGHAFVDAHAKVYAAIASSDAAGAEQAMLDLLQAAAKDTDSILARRNSTAQRPGRPQRPSKRSGSSR